MTQGVVFVNTIHFFWEALDIEPADCTKPQCEGLLDRETRVLTVTVRDIESGLETITVISEKNTRFKKDDIIREFDPPNKSEEGFSFTLSSEDKDNPDDPALIRIQVKDAAGNTTECDPVITELEIPESDASEGIRRVWQTVTDIPQAEHFVTIQNGDPGLKKLRIKVNGKPYKLIRLKDNEESMVDVSSLMVEKDNTITLIGYGVPGSSAWVTIADFGAPLEEMEPLSQVFSQGSAKDWQPRTGFIWGWGHQVK